MKQLHYILGALLSVAALVNTSCSKDPLDLGPLDYYGSGSYWKTEANYDSYIVGLHKNMRDQAWTHNVIISELRGGSYLIGTSTDGTGVSYGDILSQNFDAEHTGLSNFGDYYGKITNVNLFITRLEATDVVPEAKKNQYLGIAYGLRAFYYFDLYRTYGNVPLRLTVEVIDGEINPVNLRMPRTDASKVLAQVKADLDKSLTFFGSDQSFSRGKDFWSKAATLALAGEVYLWSAKVATLDQPAGGASDITKAKSYYDQLLSGYGLALQDNFADVFAHNKKLNSEVIFAIHYDETEATNEFNMYTYMSDGRGITPTQLNENGEPFGDPLKLNGAGGQRYQYINNMFLAYDKADSRRLATFLPSYDKDTYEATGTLALYGTVCAKNTGHSNAAGVHYFDSDMIYYRLAGVYLALAEIANYQGNGADVEKYVNLVRQRGYGSNWDKSLYGFTAGSFTDNELAILAEKDKEMVMEGQRWWDVRRMTLTKEGKHLVFCPEGNPSKDGTPLLNEATEAYKVLWPINSGVMSNDPSIEQTAGY